MSGPYLPGYDAWKTSEPPNDNPPMVACPECGELHDDFDGFGVLRCSKCGYCAHASISDGHCDLCGTTTDWRLLAQENRALRRLLARSAEAAEDVRRVVNGACPMCLDKGYCEHD